MARMSRENSVFSGLSSAEAEKRLAKHGENILSHKKAIHPARIFAGQFKDFMVMILWKSRRRSISVCSREMKFV